VENQSETVFLGLDAPFDAVPALIIVVDGGKAERIQAKFSRSSTIFML
jgi:hypothetical protein